ncbi:hypothetical protein [Amycolatopsis pithecellobii]|uniref:hypothetical protein n=1 Tax=Amycolatopsis pithecellobii TaxID=664692 RepID=UPI001AA055AE
MSTNASAPGSSRPLAGGPNVVDGALVPVLASVEQDLGIYVEPNVWLEYPLSA